MKKLYNKYIEIKKIADGYYHVCVRYWKTGAMISDLHRASTIHRARIIANQIAQTDDYYDLPIIENI